MWNIVRNLHFWHRLNRRLIRAVPLTPQFSIVLWLTNLPDKQKILSLIPGEKQIPLEMCQEENENLPNQTCGAACSGSKVAFMLEKRSLLLIVFLVETQHWVYMGVASWDRKKVQVTLFFLTAWMCFSGFLLKTQSRRGRLQKQKEGK